MENASQASLWTIVSAANQNFALPVDYVQSMVLLPEVAAIPQAPPEIRGVMNLRGRVIPVMDLRIRLGMVTLKQEVGDLITMLKAREQDHINWITELERVVHEGGVFCLATDHHLCAFGKWYYSFKTENLLLSGVLKKFQQPHKEIHAIANRALNLANSGDKAGALSLVQATKNGVLAEMLHLFDQLKSELLSSSREIAVVLKIDEKLFAVCVDNVETVATVNEVDNADTLAVGLQFQESGLVHSVGKITKNDQLVITLDVKAFQK